jgi:hypothetical protein
MGLAPFFDRARQSAAQVLKDFDADAFERRLMDVVVTLAFDRNASSTAEGAASLDMSARLAARLYPRVRVLALDGDEATAERLRELVSSINPDIDPEMGLGHELSVAVVVGASSFESDSTVYIGSDRWVAKVSTIAPVKSCDSTNPFGAGAAACVGMANVFRAVFADRIAKPALDTELQLSLLNFEIGESAENGDLPPGLDIGLVQLVGVGAIGNAFVWGMGRLRDVRGHLHLIDHETIELTNLQRYVLPNMADTGASKVTLAAAVLSDGDLTADPFSATWSDYVAGVGHHNFEKVVVALDTARDRVQVQSSLPRKIFNAWTQAGDLGVSRHGFDGDEACLACLYLPTGPRRNEDEIVAEELGFVGIEKVLGIRQLLNFGTPVGENFVREVAFTKGVPVEQLLPFATLPLRNFRQRAICGNVIMRAADGSGADLEVPLAFQSALAGVMLAAELVASTSGVRRGDVGTRSVVDLMRRIPGRITFPVLKGNPGPARCICEDSDYLEVYGTKYQD